MTKSPKLFLSLVALAVYLPTLFFGYVYLDDYLVVQESAFYSKIDNIPASFTRSVWYPTNDQYNYYRPVSTSLYILNAWFSTEVSEAILPWVFHFTNIFLQAAMSVLLFVFLRSLGVESLSSFGAALLLTVHPTSAGTVSWIPGQNELLLCVFMLAAFIAYQKALQRPLWYLAHGLFLLLGLLTKENALALPIWCALYLFMQTSRTWRSVLALFAVWLVTLIAWIFLARQGGGSSAPPLSDSLVNMWHGSLYMLIYLGKWFWPFTLTTLPTPQDTSVLIWSIGVVGALGLSALALWQWRVKPLIFLGVAWYIGFLLPTFANMSPALKDSFILRTDRGHLASVGLLIAVTQFKFSRLREWAVVVIVLSGFNFWYQRDFANGINFYRSAVEGSPRSAFAHTHLGDIFIAEKNYPQAVVQYQKALALNDKEPQAHNNLGVTYLRMNEADKARAEFEKELSFNPKNILSWANLGSIYLNRGDHEKAEFAFRQAVEINPAYRDAWAGLVQIYDFLKQEDKKRAAVEALNRAEIDMRRGI